MKCNFIICLLLALLSFSMVFGQDKSAIYITFGYFKIVEFNYATNETPKPGVIHERNVTSCDPPAGSHPMKEDICVKLGNLDGDVEKLANKEGECTKASDHQDEHSAWALGNFKGRRVQFMNAYETKCELKKGHQGIFDYE